MKLLARALSRILDVFDIFVEAVSTIARVIKRGSFAPDARSFSSSRFFSLPASDVLVQTIDLNASDRDEAKRIIRLDPERHLPLGPELATFDICGPLPEKGLRTRPERKFALGVVRRATLESHRNDMGRSRSANIEAFSHAPGAHPGIVFSFADDKGAKRRRLRRTTFVCALVLVAFAAADLVRTWNVQLESAAIEAEGQRTLAERRVRLLERRAVSAEAAMNRLADPEVQTISTLTERLALLANQQPAGTETTSVEISGTRLRVVGRTFAPTEAELYYRRVFEGQTISFSSTSGPPPVEFEMRIGSPPPVEGRT